MFDVIAITETFLDNSIADNEIEIDGFHPPFRNDRNRHGGGVAVFVKKHLSALRITEAEDPILEMIWIKIRHSNNVLYFNCTYRPPRSHSEFWDRLYDSICFIKDHEYPSFILTGDFNSNYLDRESDIIHFCELTNLQQLISEPTRIPSNTLLDLILTNVPFYVCSFWSS